MMKRYPVQTTHNTDPATQARRYVMITQQRRYLPKRNWLGFKLGGSSYQAEEEGANPVARLLVILALVIFCFIALIPVLVLLRWVFGG